LFAFLQAGYKLNQNVESFNKAKSKAAAGDEDARKKLVKLDGEKRDLTLELVKNLADSPIPFVQLKYLELNDGVVGTLGTISSAIGCYAAWPASGSK